jgi:hypothetical protein
MTSLHAMSSSIASPSTDWAPYAPRLFADLGTWSERHWTFKVYGIHHDISRDKAALIDAPILRSAQMHVRGLLDEVDSVGPHHNVGFVILHQGKRANWLLTHWWIHQDICCHLVSSSPVADPVSFARVAGPLMACVWELVVIDFERRAWISAALRTKPEFHEYLDERLPDGTY